MLKNGFPKKKKSKKFKEYGLRNLGVVGGGGQKFKVTSGRIRRKL
jgi:hypothetical protein